EAGINPGKTAGGGMRRGMVLARGEGAQLWRRGPTGHMVGHTTALNGVEGGRKATGKKMICLLVVKR
ncbi:hypothetical protein, partial [Salmonella enterica]|uniref:hypothetical protein n=1 Tax=Salmonella enterica TaxID=28901 RepID=UPI000AC71E38